VFALQTENSIFPTVCYFRAVFSLRVGMKKIKYNNNNNNNVFFAFSTDQPNREERRKTRGNEKETTK